jgi:hypothetical protein
VKASAIEELERDAGAKRAEMVELEKATPAGMWLEDLEEFQVAWNTYKAARIDVMASGAVGVASGGKKKRVVMKKK